MSKLTTNTLDTLDTALLDDVAGGKLHGSFSQSNYSQDYKVGRGDNLTSIAKHAGISVPELVRLNPQYKKNPNLIHPGDHVVTKVRR